MKKLMTFITLGIFATGFSQSDYTDYRSSITGLNWETVAANLLLSPQQKSQLFALNNQYPNYSAWSRVYANNPERWRADRFSSIERIMGADKYSKFKNKYYKGQNPVAVYNKNKHKSTQAGKYRNIQNRKQVNGHGTKSMAEYERRKKLNDGSHLYIKGKK